MQENVEFEERDFFKEPFSEGEIRGIIGNNPVADMFNYRSPSFKKMGLERGSLGDEDLIRLMLEEPRLVKRPVVRMGGKVYFGADAKALKGILDTE